MTAALAEAFVRLRVDSSVVAADVTKGVEEGAGAADVEAAGAESGEKAGKAFNDGFKAMMVGALVIAAIGAASVKMGVDFQSAMTKIQTQAGASSSQVKQLSNEVLQMAPSTEQGPIQLANALYHLKSVGLDNVDAMKALKQASDLAAVGGSDLEETTNALGAAWRSGITGAQNFGQAASTLNAIVGAGNMKMQDLVGALSTGILSVGRTFGVSLKQVGGALALMTDSGVPAQQAANELRMSISLMGAASPAAAKQLATIGLSSTALASAMRGPQGIVGAISLLKAHLDSSGMSAVQTSALLSHAFGGGKSDSAILTMLNNLDALKSKQTQIQDGMGKFASDVATQRQTAAAQVDLLKSAVETAGVRIGLALLPPLVRFVHLLVSTVVPDVIRLGGVIGNALKNPWLEALIGGLLTAAVAIKAIIVVTKAWETVQLLLKAAFADNPVGIAIVVVMALAAAIMILWKRSSTFRDIVRAALHDVEAAFHVVLGVVKTVVSWITAHWKLLAAILLLPLAPIALVVLAIVEMIRPIERVFDAITGFVSSAFDGIKHAITSGFDSWWKSYGASLEAVWRVAWDIIKAVVAPIFEAIKVDVTVFVMLFKMWLTEMTTIWRVAWTLISTIARVGWVMISTGVKVAWADIVLTTRIAWDIIAMIFKQVWAIIQAVLKIAIAAIVATVKIWWDVIVGIFDVALDLLTGKWGKAWADVQRTVQQVWNAIQEFLSSAWSAIATAAVRTWNALKSGVVSMASDLVGYFKKIPMMILDALGDVGKLLWNAGIKIVKGLIGGITSMVGDVGHAIGSVADTIKSFLPFSPARQGPLSGKGDPFYSGKSIGKKIADGLKSSKSDIKKAAAGTAADIKAALAAAVKAIASGSATSITGSQAAIKVQLVAVTSKLAGETGTKNHLEDLRKTEEGLIKALSAKRTTEDKDKPAGYKELRKAQEDEIKSLEKLRTKQEAGVSQTEQVSKTLRAEMDKLKDETTKLKDALTKVTAAATKAAAAAAKAAAAASSSESSDDSDDSDDSSSSGTPNWGALSGWLAATAPGGGGAGSGNPADGGSWQGNPGPLGGFGNGFQRGGGPRPVGRFDGTPPGFGQDGGEMAVFRRLTDQMDELIGATKAAPAKNAAGVAAAMNGVSGTAIMRGNW